ncbi:hypothetical protein P9112_004828 [Eukaryota sp. TZLM1-RC]
MFFPNWICTHHRNGTAVAEDSLQQECSFVVLVGNSSPLPLFNYAVQGALRNIRTVWLMSNPRYNSLFQIRPSLDHQTLKKISFKFVSSYSDVILYFANIHLLEDHELPSLLFLDEFQLSCTGTEYSPQMFARTLAFALDAANHVTDRKKKLDEADEGCLIVVSVDVLDSIPGNILKKFGSYFLFVNEISSGFKVDLQYSDSIHKQFLFEGTMDS